MTLLKHLPVLLLFSALSALTVVNSSCSPELEAPDTETGGAPGFSIKRVEQKAAKAADWSYDESEVLKEIKFEDGQTYECKSEGGKTTEIVVNQGYSVKYEYNPDGKISKTIQDQDAIKFINVYTYVNGFLNSITTSTSTKQSDGSYKDETVSEIKDVVADESGIQTCIYETYVGGTSFKIYDVVVTCNAEDNPLLQNAPHLGLFEYTDFFNGLFYLSEKCPLSAEYAEQGTQNSTIITCDWTLNSNGTAKKCNINAGQQTAERSYFY